MARDLIVGYDDSPASQAALDVAIDLAKAAGDRVVIAFGYEPPGSMGEEAAAARAAVRELGERKTAAALSRASAAGIEAEVALVAASPVDALLGLASERDARLIVVGHSGEGTLKAAILGSTPHKLLPVADHPVLVVPAPD